MRFATWNVNSLKARMPRVEAWLADIEPDVVCLQETKLADATFPALAFQALGYDSAHHGQGQWNGVAILSKVGIDDVVNGFADGGPPDVDARIITATCGGVRFSQRVRARTAGPSATITTTTSWPGSAGCGPTWRPRRSPSDQVVVCGDFNVAPEDRDVWDIAAFEGDTHVTPPERDALAAVEQWGLVDLFRRQWADQDRLYTYWDYRAGDFHQGRGMRIDLVLGSAPVADRLGGASSTATRARARSPPTTPPSWSTSPTVDDGRFLPVGPNAVERLSELLNADATPRSEAAAAVADAVRRLMHDLVAAAAPEADLLAAAALVNEAARLVEADASERRPWDGFARATAAGDARSFIEYSPFTGAANPLAPPLVLGVEGDRVVGEAVFGTAFEGPPGCVHGGFIAGAFDDILGFTMSFTGFIGMTGRLMVRYRKPTPLHRPAMFDAGVDGVDGRKLHTSARLHVDGVLTAEAEGLFIVVDPEVFERLGDERGA